MPGLLLFLNIGFPEMVIILVLGLLIYGRRLPEVGAQVGRTVSHLKRSLHEFKSQIDTDDDLRSVRDSFQDVRSELSSLPRITAAGTASTTAAAQAGTNGTRDQDADLWDLTDEALSSPPPRMLPGEQDLTTNSAPPAGQ